MLSKSLQASSHDDDKHAMIGSIIHSIAFGELEVINRGIVVYHKKSGIIDHVYDMDKISYDAVMSSIKKENIIDYTGKMIMPGFVDAHCHAPQYVFTGTGMDLPLLQWLEKYTFPCESRFSDLEFARLAYEKSVRRHLKYGTTFASYFATIHASAARVLVDVIMTAGQRAHVGKVSMDRNAPDFYIEDTAKGSKEAETFVRDVLSMTTVGRDFLHAVDKQQPSSSSSSYEFPKSLSSSSTLLNKAYAPLVFPCVTPRFVPTCTSTMMHSLGQISAKYGLPVQSHLSESPGEIAWVSELHPEHESYADVYHHHGLLHHATYMAHCCHSDELERYLLTSTGAGVVHCASSNFMLGSGVMDVKRFLEEGIKVALGSDVAGGYSPSMLDAIRQSIIASNCCAMEVRDGKRKHLSSSLKSSSSFNISLSALPEVSSSLPSSPSALMMPSPIHRHKDDDQHHIITDDDERNDDARNIDDAHMKRAVSFDPKSSHDDDEDHDDAEDDDDDHHQNPLLRQHGLKLDHDADDSIYDDGHTSILSSSSSKPSSATYEALNYKQVYHLATVGGAEVLGMGGVVGNFIAGKKFDAIVVDVSCDHGPIDIFGHEDVLERFQKFLFLGDDRNIISVYVDGKMVL